MQQLGAKSRSAGPGLRSMSPDHLIMSPDRGLCHDTTAIRMASQRALHPRSVVSCLFDHPIRSRNMSDSLQDRFNNASSTQVALGTLGAVGLAYIAAKVIRDPEGTLPLP